MRRDDDQSGIELSIVIPAHNEEGNIAPLVRQIDAAMTPTGIAFECVIVDDASSDGTRETIRDCMDAYPWVRGITLSPTSLGRGNGQSAAFAAGFAGARGAWIATMDADHQNDPADLPALLELRRASGADMIQGDRTLARARGDAWIRRFGSGVGRFFRRALLGDTIADTGCSLRVMRAEIARRLPLEFRGTHRFIPASARHMGYRVIETPVSHRPRHAGTPKYGAGIASRALPGLVDLLAVRWMRARRRAPACTPIEAPRREPEPTPERAEAVAR